MAAGIQRANAVVQFVDCALRYIDRDIGLPEEIARVMSLGDAEIVEYRGNVRVCRCQSCFDFDPSPLRAGDGRAVVGEIATPGGSGQAGFALGRAGPEFDGGSGRCVGGVVQAAPEVRAAAVVFEIEGSRRGVGTGNQSEVVHQRLKLSALRARLGRNGNTRGLIEPRFSLQSDPISILPVICAIGGSYPGQPEFPL